METPRTFLFLLMHLKTTLHAKLRSVLPYVRELTAKYKHVAGWGVL